jgi:hypothetical protein
MPNTPRNDEKKAQTTNSEEAIQEILRRVEEKLRRKLRLGGLTLDEIEEQSQDIGEAVKRIVEEESLHSEGTGYGGTFQSCPQGHRARYAGLRSRQIITVSGVRWLRRAYYHCSECGKGWCPTDQALGLGRGQCSRQVQALIARFSSYLPYRIAAQEMAAVCGIRLATSTVERYAQALGQRLRQEWEQLEQVREADDLPASALPVSVRPSRLHVTMDGVMAHVGGDWHEVKLGCVYQTNAVGKAVRGRYMATLSASVSFGKRLRVLAHQAGGDRCRDVAVVADGADWIWQETGKHFPRSVQVVDFYHAAEHLWAYAHARFGEGTPAGKEGTPAGKEGTPAASEWMRVQKERLLWDKVAEVIADVSAWPAGKAADQELQRRLVGYLGKHRQRMRYQTFREAGYHIGSGVAESGCKNVVQQRMKGSGMRWSQEGAEAQLQLCAHWKSAGVKDFYAYTAPQNAS